jgi:radical SAM protein with 4Fe4S-binding SPASM domain
MGLQTWFGKLSLSRKALARYQWMANFLKLFNGYSPFPLNIDLILTMRCNLACDFCVCRQEGNADIVSAFRAPELSPEDWIDIVKDIKRSFYFRPNLNLLGGEPLIYKGYLDIAAFIKQEGFRCSYTTNGVFLKRDAEEIVSIGVDVIAVSIDGAREVHNSIRGAGVFEKAAEGIRTINEMKMTQGKKAPRIFLACTISGDSHGHLSDLIDVAEELGIDYVNFLHLQFPDSEMGLHDIDVDALISEMDRVKIKAADKNVAVNFYPYLKTSQILTYYLQPSDHLGTGCISPWMRMVIVPNGKVIPCGDYVIGDVRAEGATIKGIWNSDEFRAFRQRLSRNKLLPDCERCCRMQY